MPLGNFGTVYGNNRNARQIYKTELFDAVESDNINNVKKVLQEITVLKLDLIDAEDGIRNQVALDTASANGNLDIVKALVEAGANINATDIDNISPLGYAATNGHSDIVIYLSSLRELNPNIVRTGKYADETPLMYAAWKCNKEAVEALIKKGANVNATKRVDGFKPILYAIYNVNGKQEADDIIKLLIDNNANMINFHAQYASEYPSQSTKSTKSRKSKSRKSRKSKSRKSRKSR